MNKIYQIVNNKAFAYVFWISLFIISIIQHFRIFSIELIGVHVWRQTLTQSVIDNFVNIDFNILKPRLNDLYFPDGVFRMEFPLAQWICALFIKLFGHHVLTTRLVFYAFSCLSIFGIYKLTKNIFNNKLTAYVTAWCFSFSPIIYYYSVNPLPDNLAICAIIWSIYFWVNYLNKKHTPYFLLSCFFLATATATKLPFIIFGAMYLAPIYEQLKKNQQKDFKHIYISFLFCLPAFIWYVFAIPHWSSHGVLGGVMDSNQSFLHTLDILQFNVVSTLPEFLINYATLPLFLIGFYFIIKNMKQSNQLKTSFVFASIACVAYFFYEINIISKIHDYYLFPFLPLIFLIVAKGINALQNINSSLKIFIILAIIIAPFTAYFRCNARWNIMEPGFERSYLKYKTEIKHIIHPTDKVIVYGDASSCIVLYEIGAKGWNYMETARLKKDIHSCKQKGAKFLITHCNEISNFDTDLFDSKKPVFHKGAIYIYQLQ